jgi:hypothetical protein
MPKLYEYFGLIIFFYAIEHEPVHVHGKCQGRECRAEIIVVDGRVVEIQFSPETGKPPLSNTEMNHFQELVHFKAREIVDKWIDFFILNKSIKTERITRKIKS